MRDEYVYREHQVGWVLVLLLLGSAAAVLVVTHGAEPAWPHRVALALMLLPALGLGRLTVEVAGGELRWRFGWLGWLGWPGGRIALADIRSIERCQTGWLDGWGIRSTREGMLYNMAGRDALRVTRCDGRRFRIGSADVAGLARVLEPRLQR